MLHVWEYRDATGVARRGIMRGFTDRGGTDVAYRFHRLDDSGVPIRHPNGGLTVDLVSGPVLKTAKRVGGMTLAEYGYQPGD
jgi:hypothetical protein